MRRSDWSPRGQLPSFEVTITHEATPDVELYRDLYDRVGRPWLWYERRLVPDPVLAGLLARPRHELHVARHGEDLVGFFELDAHRDVDELVFFGLALPYIGRRIGPWLLDRAIERAFGTGMEILRINTNTIDHPAAMATYRKAGFRFVRSEQKDLQDPRVLWPEVYRWPPP
jgi:GNAT superfamily N-acetyltransferase